MRTQKLLLAVAVSALCRVAVAGDAPHDGSQDASFTSGLCAACHKLHSPSGGTLLGGYDSNNDSCFTCHNTSPSPNNQLGLPWFASDQAVPGQGGMHHKWEGVALVPAYGAGLPADVELRQRLLDGGLQCATCHDVHWDTKAFAPGSVNTSLKLGQDYAKSGGAGTGTMRIDSVGAAAVTKGYRVMVRTAPPGATFIISNDSKRTPPTWLNWDGLGWIVGTQSGPGRPFTTGTPVTVDYEGAVAVVFGGAVAAGDYWDFYVSYPHLRATNVSDAMCVDCHAERVQSHACVTGTDCVADGTRVFSHPVGEPLDGTYDRVAVLDATGILQTDNAGLGDGNKTNDIALDGGTTVRCTSCHAPHNADSNSITIDKR